MKEKTDKKTKDEADPRCAACAYKHLAASYAMQGVNTLDSAYLLNVDLMHDTLLARAVVLATEVQAGHFDNIVVFRGCLAAAENYATTTTQVDAIREVRLRVNTLEALEGAKNRILKVLTRSRAVSVFIAIAHQWESQREMPNLSEEEANDFALLLKFAMAYELEPILNLTEEHRRDLVAQASERKPGSVDVDAPSLREAAVPLERKGVSIG